MRDDLHKKAPIPRKAQSVLKLALREADRIHPERLQVAARKALEQQIDLGLSLPTYHALAAETVQGELFGFVGLPQQAVSPMESDVLAGLSQFGINSKESVLQAALIGLGNSYAREARATLIAERVPECTIVINAFSSAFYAAACEVAHNVCVSPISGEVLPRLSLSEDLLGPRRRNSR